MNVRGNLSYENLRTVNGITMATYQSVCKELGLLEGDEHWKKTLSDAAVSESAANINIRAISYYINILSAI